VNIGVLTCLVAVALVSIALWFLNRPRRKAKARAAIQRRRAAHDAPDVSEAAAQDVPGRGKKP